MNSPTPDRSPSTNSTELKSVPSSSHTSRKSLAPMSSESIVSFHRRSVTLWQQFVVLYVRNLLLRIRKKTDFGAELLIVIILVASIIYAPGEKVDIAAQPSPQLIGSTYFANALRALLVAQHDKLYLVTNGHIKGDKRHKFKQVLSSSFQSIVGFSPSIVADRFASDEDLNTHFIRSNDTNIVLALSIDSDDVFKFAYSIRLPYQESQLEEGQEAVVTCVNPSLANPCNYYLQNGFTTMQTIMDNAILTYYKPELAIPVLPKMNVMIFPQAKITTIPRKQIQLSIFRILMLPAVIAPLVLMLIGTEKEKRIKEAMHIMGLRVDCYWLSWWASSSLVPSLGSFAISVALVWMDVIGISVVILFLLLQAYILAFQALVILLGSFIHTTKAAQTMGMASLVIVAIINYWLSTSSPSLATIYGLSFLPFPVLRSSLLAIATSNGSITWANGFTHTQHPPGVAIVVLTLQCLVYIYLATLVDNLHIAGNDICRHLKTRDQIDITEVSSKKRTAMNCIEPLNEYLKDRQVVFVEHLTKIYTNNKVVALDDINLSLVESQITGLLGENGSGKSSLINILTGSIAPTKGTIKMYRRSPNRPKDLRQLRSSMGICFQEDILFEQLTVLEHLQFYGGIKGVRGEELDEQIKHLLDSVQLKSENTWAKELSGGEKRKLCVLIALIGGPKIIFLDEPTSGVDPQSRRHIWKLINLYKKDRVILMSTHFMDEADIVCDRKVILVEGAVQCIGSSSFLKNKLGAGYHLRIEYNKAQSSPETITKMVKTHLPKAVLEKTTDLELIFLLPKKEETNFVNLFKAMEEEKSSTGEPIIRNFGITATSMEEVFLRISAIAKHGENNKIDMPKLVASCKAIFDQLQFKGRSFWRTSWAYLMIIKLHTIRDWNNLLMLCLFNCIFNLFLIGLIKNLFTSPNEMINFKPNLYDERAVYVRGADTEVRSTLAIFMQPKVVKGPFTLANLSHGHYALDYAESSKFPSTLLYNRTYAHSLPILINLVANMFASKNSIAIETRSYPLLPTLINMMMVEWMALILLYIVLIVVSITIALRVVVEKENKVEEYLRVVGLHPLSYWLPNLLVHTFLFLTIELIIFIFSFYAFNRTLTLPVVVPYYALFLLLFAPTSLTMCYIFIQFMPDKQTAENTLLISILFSCGILAYLTKAINKVMIIGHFYIFFSPVTFCLLSLEHNKDYAEDMANLLVSMLAQLVVLLFIVLPLTEFYQRNMFGRLWRMWWEDMETGEVVTDLDADVVGERQQVESMLKTTPTRPMLLVVDKIRKVFGRIIAVKSTSFIVQTGQIFGLLGPNGSGKTTTIRMITGEVVETSGKVVLNGKVAHLCTSRWKSVNYCPQENPLWNNITFVEHLAFYANAYGVARQQVEWLGDQLATLFKVSSHLNKFAKDLSGGNKRKLCLLINIMANTPLSIFDEPSTGVDPFSKRYLWSIIQAMFQSNKKKASILTSHSMEEVEALCTRVLILKKGTVQCIGSIQHLNNKFGSGYILEMRWTSANMTYTEACNLIRSLFPVFKVKEESTDSVKVDIAQKEVPSLAKVFATIHTWRAERPQILDCTFYQTSLEQIFLNIVRDA